MSTGNTWGKVSGDTPKSTVKAAAATPAVDERIPDMPSLAESGKGPGDLPGRRQRQ